MPVVAIRLKNRLNNIYIKKKCLFQQETIQTQLNLKKK
jgi:hypothetical protein